MTTIETSAPADIARPVVEGGRIGRFVYGAAVVLLVAWVLVPLYLLLVNTLSSPDAVQGFPKTGLPSVDLNKVKIIIN
jgi:multiple sugar transport system permease protein